MRGELEMYYGGTVIKPYHGFEAGNRIYLQESDSFDKWSANLYRTKNEDSFVVTVWDIDQFRECVKLD